MHHAKSRTERGEREKENEREREREREREQTLHERGEQGTKFSVKVAKNRGREKVLR